MKLLKPAKILSFLAVLALCTYYTNVLYNYCSTEWRLYKRKITADCIAEDLGKNPITVDIKTKKVTALKDLTIAELKGALWVREIQKEQLQLSLNSVRSALEYQGE